MIRIRARLILPACVIGGVLLPLCSSADQPPGQSSDRSASSPTAPVGTASPAAVADDAQASLGEVIVTSTRRAERLTDVPLSVVALAGGELQNVGISTTRDLTQAIPGMTAASTGYALQPAIRGITSQGTNAGEEANVSLYIDDAYIPAQYSGLMQLRDVERVEVLEGPQGTLFGRNSTGGAIRVVTRDPGDTPKLELNSSYGFDIQETQVDGFAATPLGHGFSGSASLFYLENNGILKNIAPNSPTGLHAGAEDDIAGRVKLVYRPGGIFSYNLSFDAGRSKNGAPYALAATNGNIAYLGSPGAIDPRNRPFTVSQSTNTELDISGYGATGTGTVDLGSMVFKSITAARHTEGSFASDSDRTNLSLGASTTYPALFHTDNISQEFQLSSTDESRWVWITGLYLYGSDSIQGFDIWASDPGGTLGSAFAGRVRTKSLAPFGDLTYKFTREFEITGGLRFTSENKEYRYEDIFRSGGLPLRESADSKTWNNVSYKAVAQYKFTPDMNVYASFSTGFKSGVYNTSSFAIDVVDPEKIKAVEVGFKGRVTSGLFLTAAAFHYDYDNIQLSSYDNSPGILLIQLTNAAKAKIDGLETNANFNMGDSWSGNAGVSFIPRAEYLDFPDAAVFRQKGGGVPGNLTIAPYDASGTRMIRTPRVTFNAGLNWHTMLLGGRAEAGATYYYNSGFLFAPGEVNPLAAQDAYKIVNAHLAWTAPSGHYTFTLFGENLTNTYYGTYQNDNALGDAVAFSRPRVTGIRFSYTY